MANVANVTWDTTKAVIKFGKAMENATKTFTTTAQAFYSTFSGVWGGETITEDRFVLRSDGEWSPCICPNVVQDQEWAGAGTWTGTWTSDPVSTSSIAFYGELSLSNGDEISFTDVTVS